MKTFLACCLAIGVLTGIFIPMTSNADEGDKTASVPRPISSPATIQITTAPYISASFPPTALLTSLITFFSGGGLIYGGKIQDTVQKTLYRAYFYSDETSGFMMRMDIQKTDTNLWQYKMFYVGEGGEFPFYADILRKAYP